MLPVLGEFEGRVRWVLHSVRGCVCVFYWKTTDFMCLNRLNVALDEWHSETEKKGKKT